MKTITSLVLFPALLSVLMLLSGVSCAGESKQPELTPEVMAQALLTESDVTLSLPEAWPQLTTLGDDAVTKIWVSEVTDQTIVTNTIQRFKSVSAAEQQFNETNDMTGQFLVGQYIVSVTAPDEVTDALVERQTDRFMEMLSTNPIEPITNDAIEQLPDTINGAEAIGTVVVTEHELMGRDGTYPNPIPGFFDGGLRYYSDDHTVMVLNFFTAEAAAAYRDTTDAHEEIVDHYLIEVSPESALQEVVTNF